MSLQKKSKFVLVMILLVILSACASQTSSPEPEVPTTEPQVPNFPTPESEKASFAGRVVDTNGKPISNLQLRLAEVYRSEDGSPDGAYVLDTAFSPGAISNENGYFIFSNIEPMEYVLVLGNPESVYEIVLNQMGKAKVWQTKANQVLDIGELISDFNPSVY